MVTIPAEGDHRLVLEKSGDIWDSPAIAFQKVPLFEGVAVPGSYSLKTLRIFNTYAVILYFWEGSRGKAVSIILQISVTDYMKTNSSLLPFFFLPSLLFSCLQSFYLTRPEVICIMPIFVLLVRRLFLSEKENACIADYSEFKCCYTSWSNCVSMVEAVSALLLCSSRIKNGIHCLASCVCSVKISKFL